MRISDWSSDVCSSDLDPGLVTETSFDVNKLLKDHTRVRYRGVNGMTLPETYNGLGTRNLVYMLLQLLRFFREYQATPTSAGVHLIFIEDRKSTRLNSSH